MLEIEYEYFSYIQYILAIPVIYAVFWAFFIPFNRRRKLEDVGWAHLRHKGLWTQNTKFARKLRQTGKIPGPFPNGWYVLLESHDLGAGEVRQVDALGLNFAVFRGVESGAVFVTGAYCPHLGANLCAGGRVEKDCITCPFHGWSFSGKSGHCESVPYSKASIPKNAALKKFICQEQNGLIYVWHNKQGKEPYWWPTAHEGINSKQWTYQGRNEYYVNCHIQDIPENGADTAHLSSVHKSGIMCGGEPSSSSERFTNLISTHCWSAQWEPTKEQHIARVQLTHAMQLLGRWKVLPLDVEAVQIGPATTHLYYNSIMGKGVMIQYILPVEPMVQKLVHVFYTERTWLPPYAKLVLLGESIHVERDIRVWNNKRFCSSPVLVKEDSPILKFRRWYSQFYSEETLDDSPRSLDW